MNTILICNFIFMLMLMSAKAKTMADIYDSFMKIEYEHEQACLKDNNLSEAMADSMARSGVFDNRDFKCYLNCMLIKSKCINDKGEILVDNIKELSKAVNIPYLEKFITDCVSKINENDSCERAVLIDKCFTEEVKIALEQSK